MPTDDPVDVLFGVPDPNEVKTILAYLLDDASSVGELKKIRGLLEKKDDDLGPEGPGGENRDEDQNKPEVRSSMPSEGGH